MVEAVDNGCDNKADFLNTLETFSNCAATINPN
jgi:hypothetical protein